MTWRYDQSNGDITRNGVFVGTGYSGAGRTAATGRNNPAMEAEQGRGPIPRGRWKIGPAYKHPNLGPICMVLTPVGHEAHGRTLFRIHGNNTANDASHGCIIAAPGIRKAIADSGDTELEVVN